jgi:FkbM family methyltransferase
VFEKLHIEHSRALLANTRLVARLEDISYKYKIVTRNVQVNSHSFKIYSAAPFRMNLDMVQLLTSIVRNVRNEDVVYDVGSNVGVYSLSIARHQPLTSIFAFEPNPETFLKLKANLELNKEFSVNIKPLQIALGNTDGMSDFFLSSQHLRSSLYEYNAAYANAQIKRRVKVKVRTIDSLVAEGRVLPPQHIKIDTEGAESHIIKGGLRTLSKHLPLVYLEHHKTCISEPNPPHFQEILESLGYRLFNKRDIFICYPPNQPTAMET